MKKLFLTLDGGTSNTRLSLVRDEKILATLRIALGARAGINGTQPLKDALREGIPSLLQDHGLCADDVECILASGMITSEFGLYTLPHLPAPVGIGDLRGGMKRVHLKEITPIPFCFIPGVKVVGDGFLSTDMMRGEETELMGVMREKYGDCVYVLPGSHSKVIKTDRMGRIEQFSTLLTGEMAQALAENTILRSSVDLKNDALNATFLYKGYLHCRAHGINQALFKARVAGVLFGTSPEEIYSFYLGVILCPEVGEILSYTPETVVVGGRKQLREALALLLEKIGGTTVVKLSEQEVAESVTRGMLRIYYAQGGEHDAV